MAGPESGRRSGRKSKGKQPAAKRRPTGNAAQNTQTKERTINQLPKLERDQPIEKLPSNSPTMAIAPSDYEHIFHEATGVIAQPRETTPNRNNSFKPPPASPPNLVQVSPPPPTGQQLPGGGGRYPRSPEVNYGNNQLGPTNSNPRAPAEVLMISPDGYSILGQQPAPEGASHRRAALPAHIVRASNQFSRAALSRVAKYLASRADPPR